MIIQNIKEIILLNGYFLSYDNSNKSRIKKLKEKEKEKEKENRK